ncbi:MAG: B12-binding domain-containing radical SAM protein [Candidatus Wolfebacteria bacterium]|nr:B12-binding domain-containing radical SAM protein [Candidatus Wolfebacteria bacterium]
MKVLLVAYDNDSHISFFPLGLAYLASACRLAGHEVRIYNQDVYHWPEEHLTNFLNNEAWDVIGVGVIGGYYQYRKLLKISVAINNSKNRPFFVIGGHGPSPEPEYFLKKTGADAVVIGEGEETFVELLSVLETSRSFKDISGIAFFDCDNGQFVQNKRRELIADINRIPFPAWDLFPMEHYALARMPNILNSQRCMIMLSGRGCKFKCNFCYRMDQGLRIRSSRSIVEEIKTLQDCYQIDYFAFYDELLMNSEQRVKELCQVFLDANLKINWECNGRLNYAKPDVLRLMKKSGCVFINYGIESMDEAALKRMNKALTVKQIESGIRNTLMVGISPGFNIIFGNIGETAQSLRMGLEFLLKYDDHSQLRTIRPVTPYPGSPLYYYAIEKGLLDGPEDFYERKHLNSDLLAVNFTDMSDDKVHRLLFEVNKKLIEKFHIDQSERHIEAAARLYLEKNVNFRGFRDV